jgi:hypothetical protein
MSPRGLWALDQTTLALVKNTLENRHDLPVKPKRSPRLKRIRDKSIQDDDNTHHA